LNRPYLNVRTRPPAAPQFNRHQRQLRPLRTRLGRLIRDIRRKIAGDVDLEAAIPDSHRNGEETRNLHCCVKIHIWILT
jgi:hypothetical protein